MKYTALLLTGFSLFGFITGLPQRALAQFSQVEPYVDNSAVVKPVESYKQSMIRAMALHNIQYQLNYMLNLLIPAVEEQKEKLELACAQLGALQSCFKDKLGQAYDPLETDKVYQTIKEAFNEKVKNITVYINETGETTQQTDNAESYPYWRVAREVMIDVYKNPEKYGKKVSDFPLWTDQKYLYTQEVNNILSGIQKNFSLPDANNQQNQELNNKLFGYLNAFTQQNSILTTTDYATNSKKYTQLLDYLKTHPKYGSMKQKILPALPKLPQPLPPFYEIIQLTEDPAQTGTMFPEWPSPWAEYIRRGLDKRAVGGEMDTCFLPKTISLRPEVQNWDKTKINNPLSLEKEKEENVENIVNLLNLSVETLKSTIKNLNESLAENGLDIKINVELQSECIECNECSNYNYYAQRIKTNLEQSNIAEVQKAVKAAKMETIDKALKLFKQSPQTAAPQNASVDATLGMLDDMDPNSDEYKNMMNLLNAGQSASDEKFLKDMQQDADGIAMQDNVSTNDVKQNIESQESQYALQKEAYEDAKKERDVLWNTPIDIETCINQGVQNPKH